jgi:hypothetical protein
MSEPGGPPAVVRVDGIVMHLRTVGLALAAAALFASCAPRPAPPAPTPAPPPRVAERPPPPAPPPASADWQERPLAAGDWRMSGEGTAAAATFEGDAGPLFRIACAGPGRVRLSATAVAAAPGAALAVRTTYGERVLNGAEIPAADPLLDQMAFSRGRFLVRAAGAGELVLPSWPEPAWVVEQCRGA